MAQKQALGKGLSALMGINEVEGNQEPNQAATTPSGNQTAIAIHKLHAGKFQPRIRFDQESLQELADSIKANGIIQPIVARRVDDGYEVVAGERRWRAAKLAGLNEVPVIVKEFTDKQALEVAIIENIQRRDLTPIEEAEGYKRLQEEFSYKHGDLADVLGKSRSHISNALRILTLPKMVKTLVDDGELTMGHARVLAGLPHPEELAEAIVKKKLNVRQAEKLATSMTRKVVYGGDSIKKNEAETQQEDPTNDNSAETTAHADIDEDLLELETTLTRAVGLKVTIANPPESNGQVSIHFSNLAELDKILQTLTR